MGCLGVLVIITAASLCCGQYLAAPDAVLSPHVMFEMMGRLEAELADATEQLRAQERKNMLFDLKFAAMEDKISQLARGACAAGAPAAAAPGGVPMPVAVAGERTAAASDTSSRHDATIPHASFPEDTERRLDEALSSAPTASLVTHAPTLKPTLKPTVAGQRSNLNTTSVSRGSVATPLLEAAAITLRGEDLGTLPGRVSALEVQVGRLTHAPTERPTALPSPPPTDIPTPSPTESAFCWKVWWYNHGHSGPHVNYVPGIAGDTFHQGGCGAHYTPCAQAYGYQGLPLLNQRNEASAVSKAFTLGRRDQKLPVHVSRLSSNLFCKLQVVGFGTCCAQDNYYDGESWFGQWPGCITMLCQPSGEYWSDCTYTGPF